MELLKGISAVDLAVLIDDALVISDVHIGFEEALNKQGMLVPRDHFPQLMKRMETILSQAHNVLATTTKTNKRKHNEDHNKKSNEHPNTNQRDNATSNKKLKNIIINGDLKHEFGRISEQEWRHTLKFLDFLGKHCEKVILVKGNHDTILGPIAEKRNLEIHDHYELRDGEVLLCHGDKLPAKEALRKAKLIVIGHEHPSVALRQGPRVEKYKCFFVGSYKKKKLIVLPSLNLLTEGSALMHDDVLSPFLKQRMDDFEVYVVEDKVYRFGKLKNLVKL
jgi:putative SbcD/Mre11-related phosphoesterase